MRWLISSLVCLFIATMAFAERASDDDTGRDDKQVFHLYNDVDLISTLKLQYDKPRMVIKSVYPQLESGNSDNDNSSDITGFNEQVVELVQQSISDFKSYVNENVALQKTMQRSKVRNDFYVDYDAAFIRPNSTPILSVRFSTQGFVTGMAHPYHKHFVFNYNLKDGTEIELSDLFKENSDYLIVLSNYSSSKLYRRLRNREMIAQGTAPVAENFKHWNIKANGLLITFEEATVAPYYLGAQTVLIPYAVLKNIISLESPLAKCVLTKQRCGTDLLLTGGFIDEAENKKVEPKHNQSALVAKL